MNIFRNIDLESLKTNPQRRSLFIWQLFEHPPEETSLELKRAFALLDVDDFGEKFQYIGDLIRRIFPEKPDINLLMEAAKLEDTYLINLCLREGVPITAQTEEGETLLKVAERTNSLALYTILAQSPETRYAVPEEFRSRPECHQLIFHDLPELPTILIGEKGRSAEVKRARSAQLYHLNSRETQLQRDLHAMISDGMWDQSLICELSYPLLNSPQGGGAKPLNIKLQKIDDENLKQPEKVNGRTPLLKAVSLKNRAAVDALIEKGVNVNLANDEGFTPLMQAVSLGEIALVQKLLDSGASVNLQSAYGMSAGYWAAMKGRTDVLRLLKERGENLLACDDQGSSLLLRAVAEGHYETALFLIEKGADIEKANRSGYTPLSAAIHFRDTKMVRLLLAAEASIEGKKGSSSPICLAAHHGDNAILKELLRKGASPNHQGEKNSTPLHVACRQGHEETALILLECGALPFRNDDSNQTPFELALDRGWSKLVKRMVELHKFPEDLAQSTLVKYAGSDNLKALSSLLDLGVSTEGLNVLHISAQTNSLGCILILIQNGADANHIDDQGNTPLHIAIQKGFVEAARALLDHGAAMEVRNNLGETPFFVAVKLHHIDLARLLQSRGAHIAEGDARGITPMQLALFHPNREMVSFLQESGIALPFPHLNVLENIIKADSYDLIIFPELKPNADELVDVNHLATHLIKPGNETIDLNEIQSHPLKKAFVDALKSKGCMDEEGKIVIKEKPLWLSCAKSAIGSQKLKQAVRTEDGRIINYTKLEDYATLTRVGRERIWREIPEYREEYSTFFRYYRNVPNRPPLEKYLATPIADQDLKRARHKPFVFPDPFTRKLYTFASSEPNVRKRTANEVFMEGWRSQPRKRRF